MIIYDEGISAIRKRMTAAMLLEQKNAQKTKTTIHDKPNAYNRVYQRPKVSLFLP